MATISARLTALENMRPTRLIVLCTLQDGSEATLPAAECIRQGADFKRVLDGNSLDDAKMILDYLAGPSCAIC